MAGIMTLYVIFLPARNEEVWNSLRSSYADHYVLDDRTAFVRTENTLTQNIADEIGISPRASGIVVQMDYFAGRADGSFIEWLNKT
ncbi:MAG: hypothetical protein OXJ38_08370 [Gammaproteobacteria bacterium]|nr:hypothetical protein [Gammaproteobacteria bacterium]